MPVSGFYLDSVLGHTYVHCRLHCRGVIVKILVTGTAGFIGYHLAAALAVRGDEVLGIDNLSDYYDVGLKIARLEASGIRKKEARRGKIARSGKYPGYRFARIDLLERGRIMALFERERFDAVCHLAAQAGVRHSIKDPHAYIDSNIAGFMNVLEGCRNNRVGHLVFASSSSVYGLNEKMPFSTSDNVDHPVSIYGATKKANELMAHSYSHLFGLPATGLRFFTVYGPWGRPDMAPILFAKAIAEGRRIDVFNNGEMERDFTYVGDIVGGVVRVLDRPPRGNPAWNGTSPDPGSSRAPYKIYNIGNSLPVKLLDFIETLERAIGKKAEKNFLPMQPGDVPATYADVSDLARDIGYSPSTTLEAGVRAFVAWFHEYYGQ
ncbi:MAG: NAD-dependent epimerase [Spirochaetes bacterium]|nr:NAD-dependent epimerase [Spirochaetota bacterium]